MSKVEKDTQELKKAQELALLANERKEEEAAVKPAKSRGRKKRSAGTQVELIHIDDKLFTESPIPDKLGEILVQQGIITRHQLFNALNESYTNGCTLKEALLNLEYVDAAALSQIGDPENS